MNIFFALGSFFGGLSVALGAFGAHALADRIPPDRLANFETGARYQMYHALALLAVALAVAYFPSGVKLLNAGGWLFTAGIILFSGSLYILSISGIRWLGAVTPLGGVAFAAGWILLLLAAWQAR